MKLLYFPEEKLYCGSFLLFIMLSHFETFPTVMSSSCWLLYIPQLLFSVFLSDFLLFIYFSNPAIPLRRDSVKWTLLEVKRCYCMFDKTFPIVNIDSTA